MVSVVGGGAWGQALAKHISQQSNVQLVCRNPDTATKDQGYEIIDLAHFNGAEDIIYTAVSSAFCEVMKPIIEMTMPKNVLIASKGFVVDEDGTSLFYHDWLSNIGFTGAFGILSGPSFASEINKEGCTCLNLATTSDTCFERFHSLLNHHSVSTIRSNDYLGVEIAGAFKNMVAILVGWLDVKTNDSANTRFALIVKALRELEQVLEIKGGDVSTVYDYAGVGDLMLTCLNHQSRNWRFGQLLGSGLTKDQALKRIATVEGLNALGHFNSMDCKSPLIDLIEKVVDQQVGIDAVLEYISN